MKRLSIFVWPVIGCLLLAVASLHPVWPSRPAKLTGDFGSHTLNQSFIVLAVLLLLWRGLRTPARYLLWWPFAVTAANVTCVELLKRVTHLPRPQGAPTGFPSSHTAYAFALAWLLTQITPRWAPLWYGIAVSIGWSRMEGLAHYPYQVICGAILGTAIGYGVSRIKGNSALRDAGNASSVP